MSSNPALAQEALSFLRAIELSKATELARSGQLSEAESMVSELVADPNCAGVATDLLARIRVQQGRFFEAQKLWMDLAKLNPSDSRSRKALVATKKLIDWGLWYSVFRILPILVCGLILAAGITMATRRYVRGVRASNGGTVQANLESLKPVTSGPQQRPLDLGLNVPGTVIHAGNEETDVHFESDLFTEGTMFRPAAAKIVEDLARQIHRNGEGIEVIVEGRTDDLPVSKSSRFRDNLDLGNARAEVLSRYLIRFGGLSASQIFFQRDSRSPDAKHGLDTRMRNRTVALRIRRLRQ